MYIPDLIPIFVCVVLPIAIVLIVSLRKRNSDNKRAEILIKAIESGNDFNTDKLADALRKRIPNEREVMYGRLLRGCMYSLIGIALLVVSLCAFSSKEDSSVVITVASISLAIGLAYLIVYFVSRNAYVSEKYSKDRNEAEF